MSQPQTEDKSSSPDAQPGGYIRLLALEDSDPGRVDRSLKRPQDWRLGRAEIPVDVFRDRVSGFLESMRQVITDLPQAFGGYELDQVTISAEVSAKGQISLMGSGAELAGKSGLTFTFTHRASAEAAAKNDIRPTA
jgi:hypothetical protein